MTEEISAQFESNEHEINGFCQLFDVYFMAETGSCKLEITEIVSNDTNKPFKLSDFSEVERKQLLAAAELVLNKWREENEINEPDYVSESFYCVL